MESEFLLKIKQQDEELWSVLLNLADLYKDNPIKAKGIIDEIVALVGRE